MLCHSRNTASDGRDDAAQIARRHRDVGDQILREIFSAIDLDAPESVDRQAAERRLRVHVGEHVNGLVPRAAEDVASGPRGVPHPFLDVAGHRGRSGPIRAARALHREQFLAAEIARRHDVAAEPLIGRAAPVIDRRQRFASPPRKCGGFVPTDAADRMLGQAGRIAPLLPLRRARPSRCVDEHRHRLGGRDRLAVFDKRLPPQLRTAIAAIVDEAFELAIRDLVPVDPVVGQRDRRQMIEPGMKIWNG